jgi:ATP phosphoribosyltransferase
VITIALPTGALLEGSLDLLRRAGVADLTPKSVGRRLLLEQGSLRVVLVKPADVAAYVDFGAADLGIVGKDVLWESQGSHYELADLVFGGCALVVAVGESSPLGDPRTWPPQLRVATKYPMAAATFMAQLGLNVDIIKLHGSVELAPAVRLADAIVDLTATGTTIRENRLRIVGVIAQSTARLIVNQASLKTLGSGLQDLVAALKEAVIPNAD